LSEYVVLKLCTGDQLMAAVVNETADGISVIDPIHIKTIPVMQEGEYVEQVISSIYCQFTKERHFTFNHKDMIYCKQLNPIIVKYYKKLVLAFGEEKTQTESFYDKATEEDVEKLQKELTTKSIKLH
jgi:hypothetical protein